MSSLKNANAVRGGQSLRNLRYQRQPCFQPDILDTTLRLGPFQEAAAAQAKSLAFNPAIVWVPHPIQNRTEAELTGLAEEAMAGILAMITP